MRLHDFVARSAARAPESLAVSGPDESLTYGQLESLGNRVARGLGELGVGRGDRVGLWLDKSARAVAVMQGVLKLGAAYVPVDPRSPASRAYAILNDCQVSALVSTQARANTVRTDALAEVPTLLCDCPSAPGLGWDNLQSYSDDPIDDDETKAGDLAYILYTSGSTGRPKGVCISHGNALALVEWAVSELEATPTDRFANHAPLHFDISVLNIYGAFSTGACVYLVPEDLSFSGKGLVNYVRANKISLWYLVSSVLILMMEAGGLLDAPPGPLRTIMFGGEVFPIKHLRRLRDSWPEIRLLNFYGTTETRVCTFYEVHDIAEGQTRPVPIGRACPRARVWAARSDGTPAAPGEEGELWVEGPTVMLGYWGGAPLSGPHATGDLVVERPDGNYDYLGRRDHQVQIRGNRVELGEIEVALLQHEEVREVCVVVAGEGAEAKLVAFAIFTKSPPPSLLAIKRHCAERLPRYMIVDRLCASDDLPRTASGKIDRGKLKQAAESRHPRRPA